MSKLVTIGAFVLSSTTGVALAQTTPSEPPTQSSDDTRQTTVLEQVVVTAQRREESAQSVPVAISVLGGDALQDRNISNLNEVSQLVPNLNLAEVQGRARITLRGVGLDSIAPGVEGAVAFHTDNVFISRSAVALASFYDIERIEVLRGPQGTLYGRNATGGSINVLTHRPTSEMEGYARLTMGDYSTVNTEAAISGPIAGETLLGRFAMQTQYHEGYGHNVVTGNRIDGKDSYAGRLQLAYSPTDALSVRLGVDYYRNDTSSGGYHFFGPGARTVTGEVVPTKNELNGGFQPNDIRDIAATEDPHLDQLFYGGVLDVSYQVGDFTLKSLTSARKTENDLDYSIVLGSLSRYATGNSSEHARQFSQEFQFSSETDRNKFVAGLYYIHENNFGFTEFPFSLVLFGGPDVLKQGFFSGGRLITDAGAVYGQDTFSFTDRLRLTVGGRYSYERKKIDERSQLDLVRDYSPDNALTGRTSQNDESWDSFTPRVGIDFDLARDVMLYATYSQGFKSGTFSLGSILPPLKPEEVEAYELGLKSTLLDGRMQANVAAFYYDYTNLQVGKVIGNIVALENAATARVRGVEADILAQPFDVPFTISLSAAYLDAEFTDYITADPSRPGGDGVTVDNLGAPAFNLAGNKLSQAPEYKINLALEYGIDIGASRLTLRGESVWTSEVFFSAYNRPEVSEPDLNLINAFIHFETGDHRWEAGLYGRNLTDETAGVSATVLGPIPGFPISGYLDAPRTFGATVGYRF